MTNHSTCSECGQKTVPRFESGTAVACQNPGCRTIFNREHKKIGRFVKGWKRPRYLKVIA